MRLALVVPITAILVTACGRTTEPVEVSSTTVQAAAGDTIALRIGDTAVLGADVRVTFRAVDADSRCPTNVDCVWEGDAEIRLDAEQTGGGHQTLELHTTLQPRAAAVGGFRIEVIDLAPRPTHPDPIQPRHYSVRLAISRG